jgi:peptidyl-dipeptidase A
VTEVETVLQSIVEQYQPLRLAYTLAEWEAATHSTPENNRRNQETQAAEMRFWSNPDRLALLKRLDESGAAGERLQARLVRVFRLRAEENQQDEDTIQRLTQLEAEVRGRYYNFRAEVDGRQLTDNELDAVLSKSDDTELVQEAWEASKQVGGQVAGFVRELARTRNAAARRQGYRDHFARSLAVNEIDETELFSIFAELEAATDEPFARLKAEIDRERASHFRIAESELAPWHYGDRFFSGPPPMGGVDMDHLFTSQDPVALATATYDGFGLEVRDILERSDLYARPGKDQHAFCTDIDHSGDVRTLNNLEPNHRWNETLLHELGHAVYDKFQNPAMPWALRTPPHTLSTEAIALLMGSLTFDADWLTQIAGVPSSEAAHISQAASAQARAQRLIFTRWVLVMTNFERALYANPEGDLDSLWWELVERFQGLRRPAGRQQPDWAAKIHVALYPVYYHNYELGHLMAAQLLHHLRAAAGGLVNRPAAGRWLVEKFFYPGNGEPWNRHIRTATGEPLTPRYFVESLAG